MWPSFGTSVKRSDWDRSFWVWWIMQPIRQCISVGWLEAGWAACYTNGSYLLARNVYHSMLIYQYFCVFVSYANPLYTSFRFLFVFAFLPLCHCISVRCVCFVCWAVLCLTVSLSISVAVSLFVFRTSFLSLPFFISSSFSPPMNLPALFQPLATILRLHFSQCCREWETLSRVAPKFSIFLNKWARITKKYPFEWVQKHLPWRYAEKTSTEVTRNEATSASSAPSLCHFTRCTQQLAGIHL